MSDSVFARQARCSEIAPALVGKLVRRGRKLFWVAYTHCTGSVQLVSCTGAYKSFPVLADEIAPLALRNANAADMNPNHRGSAHKMLGTFLMQGSQDAAAAARAVLAR